MGDPKKPKKNYRAPTKPWNKERIDAEKALIKEYGLKNKTEIWRASSMLSKFKAQAKKCAAAETEQLQKEKKQLLNRLHKLGLLGEKASLDDVLSLSVENLLDKRLQTMVLKKALASTAKQARQFIVHGHITVNAKKVTVPSYIVTADEQDKIRFTEGSTVQPEQKNE